ncbi:MAG: hypothetical protein ACT6XY_01280 [Phreatobacter sp.]|jgi:hypothetical protein|uniref:hypothetical protein n=1 Tax=Phreatobacter sp. TaxID=1966341 RepID=UPI004036029B
MITRRLMTAAALLAVPLAAAYAQVPPVQPDGGMGGASSAGGSSGGGMTADDEDAQGVEAGQEGRTVRDRENAERGKEAVEVDPRPDPRSPASGGVPAPPAATPRP